MRRQRRQGSVSTTRDRDFENQVSNREAAIAARDFPLPTSPSPPVFNFMEIDDGKNDEALEEIGHETLSPSSREGPVPPLVESQKRRSARRTGEGVPETTKNDKETVLPNNNPQGVAPPSTETIVKDKEKKKKARNFRRNMKSSSQKWLRRTRG